MYNYILEISALSMIIAQLSKLFTKYFVKKEWDFNVILSTGGMPSSHTSLVTTLSLTLGLIYGFASTEFAISFVFGAVIVHDAMGIRYEAGKHASVLNRISEDIKYILGKEDDSEKRFKELLGHHPIEVFGGFLLGIVVALVGYYGFYI